MMFGYLINDVMVNQRNMWNVSTEECFFLEFSRSIFMIFFSLGARRQFIYKGDPNSAPQNRELNALDQLKNQKLYFPL